MADTTPARIVATPGTCGGAPRLDGTRLTVHDLLGFIVRHGMTEEQLRASIPSLPPGAYEVLLAHYREHQAEWDEKLLFDRYEDEEDDEDADDSLSPVIRFVSTPDTCAGQLRFDGTRLPVASMLPLVVLHGYTETQLIAEYPSFPAGGVEALWAHYREHKPEWEARFARDKLAERYGDCCEAWDLLRNLVAALEHPNALTELAIADAFAGKEPSPTWGPTYDHLYKAVKEAKAALDEHDVADEVDDGLLTEPNDESGAPE